MRFDRRLSWMGAAMLPLAMAGCGGSGGGTSTGTLSLSLTDAPIDGAQKVEVQFSGIEVHGAGASYEFYFCKDENDVSFVSTSACTTADVQTIDLLQLTGGVSTTLLDAQNLAAGHYQWIRLMVDAASITDSIGGVHSMTIPSGAQNGLKLVSGFDVAAGGVSDFTVDFDLRKSVRKTGADYFLRPTLRIVDNSSVGAIAGTVATGTATAGGCTPVVYVYDGSDQTPDDIGGATEPITTAAVTLDSGSGNYTYKAAFLSAGDYTVAFTCDSDDPTADDAMTYSGTANVTVAADSITTHDFN